MIPAQRTLLLFLFSALVFHRTVFCSDGLCGLEPPKDGGDCSMSKKSVEHVIEQQVLRTAAFDGFPENETEIWSKRFYRKMAYTNKLDWNIREILDDAEDYIANEPEVAIKKLKAILEKYPDSPRANYDLVRALQFRLHEREEKENLSDEEILKQSFKIVNKFFDIIVRYESVPEDDKEDDDVDDEDEVEPETESDATLPLPIFSSAIHQVSIECDNANLTKFSTDILERVFDLNPGFLKIERYHVVLIEKYFILGDWESMETAVERARKYFPQSLLLKFFEGILLKKLDQKKRGNKVLREIEFEDNAAYQFADEIRQIGRALYNRGLVGAALDLFRETSKVHGFLSQYQRPILSDPDLEGIPLWSQDEQVSLTKYTEEFDAILAKFNDVKADALQVAKNLTDGWFSQTKVSHDQNLIKGSGNWSVFPIFAWGKTKHYACHKASVTCKLIKNSFPLAAGFSTGVVKFEYLAGQTQVLPHCGPINTRLRLILPVQVPEDNSKFTFRIGKNTSIPFREGEPVIIDDSFEHEMNNSSDEPAMWLSIDFPHPDLPYGNDKKDYLSPYAKRFFMTY